MRTFVRATLLGAHLTLVPVAPLQAAGGLRVTADAVYTVDQDDSRVKVTIDFTVTNTTPNKTTSTQIVQYYFNDLRIGIHEEAKNLKASGGASIARNKKRDGFREVDVRFGNLFYRRTDKFRVTYDLPGGDPRSESTDIRVNPAYAWFYVYVWGDKGRSSVEVRIPDDYTTSVQGGSSNRLFKDGYIIYRAEELDPQAWWMAIRAEQPDELSVTEITAGDEKLTVKAWPDDVIWRTRVSDLLGEGVPTLEELTGLDWPVDDSLEVIEVGSGDLEGYAGVFIDFRNGIRITETLDDHVIVHEAAHAYFNESFAVDRWITEGLADDYAARTLRELGKSALFPEVANPEDDAAVDLNHWAYPGRIDEETEAAENYGYNTSWYVIRWLVDDVGESSMRKVFDAIDQDLIAYQGEGQAEKVETRSNWKRFLDLVEEVGGADKAETIFRQFVVDDAQAKLLDERADARIEYQDLVEDGGTWKPPMAIRDHMADWDFEKAQQQIVSARHILTLRDELSAVTDKVGVSPPASLEHEYESAQTDFIAAETLALDQLATVQLVAAAENAIEAPRDLVTRVGLWQQDPAAGVAAAEAAFEADQMGNAADHANAVLALIAGSVEIGRQRLLWSGIALALLLLGIVYTVRKRHKNKRRNVVIESSAIDDSTNGLPKVPVLPGGPSLSDGSFDYLTLGEGNDPTG